MSELARPTHAAHDLDLVTAAFKGRYAIQSPLRVGGQAVVYAALTQTSDGSPAVRVALKLYTVPLQYKRADREITTLRALNAPTLARLVDAGFVHLGVDEVPYTATAYIEGAPLDRYMLQGAVEPMTVTRLGRDIAFAIGALWDQRIVHRDVTPKNIMVRPAVEGGVLIDLGLARPVHADPITTTGSLWGTKGYLSPEQMANNSVLTCATDVYALGVSLWEALAGTHPTGHDQEMLLKRGPIAAPLPPSTPPSLVMLLQRMLDGRAAFRPRPRDVAHACEAILALN